MNNKKFDVIIGKINLSVNQKITKRLFFKYINLLKDNGKLLYSYNKIFNKKWCDRI